MRGSLGATTELRLAMFSRLARALRTGRVIAEALGAQVSMQVHVDDFIASAFGESERVVVGRTQIGLALDKALARATTRPHARAHL